MFRSLRSRLILSFVAIVVITLLSAGLALFARLGGYRDQVSASTLRAVASPIYYNLTLFTPTNNTGAGAVVRGQRLRRELTDYLKAQAQDAHVIVLLIDANGNVIEDGTTDTSLANEHFDVPPAPVKGPNFSLLPQQKHQMANGVQLLYVTVPMPAAVRNQPAGINAIVVALPEAQARDVFRDLLPRLLFAGVIGVAAGAVVAVILWASLYRPLGRVARGIRSVAGGNYRDRVPASGPSEVRELAHDVNAMADSVEGSQRTLREFLANISHELKTPLTSIRGFSQAMVDGTLETPEERARAVRVIDSESRRVLHLVEELLDLSRIESGQQKMDVAPVRASELLARVEDVFSMRAGDAGVTLRIVAPPTDAGVMADFERIEQVLGNLVDNAFRHTRRGGSIEAGARTPGGRLIELYVADDGDGIAPEEIAHVFDRFYRSGGEASGSGTGLGLAISREIVRAHGGEIRVGRRPGGGTIFTFTLPAARKAAATVAKAPAEVPRASRDRIAGS